MSSESAHPFRRTAIVSVVALVATAFTWLLPSLASAQEEFIPGSGRAKVTIVRVGPSAAQLSLSPAIGVALSDYVNTVGRGESLIVDWVGVHNSVHSCCLDLVREFPVLRAVTGEAGAAEGRRWEPKPTLVEAVQATGAPVGRSSVAIEGFNLPGILEVVGGQSRSFSGVYKVPGKDDLMRAAGGTVDIPRVTILGGRVVMHDLRWEVAQVTDENDDAEPEAIGTFRLGRLVADGQVQGEGMSHEELDAVLGPINEGLAPLGVAITSPTVKLSGQVASIGSLGIRAASSHLSPLAEGIQPLRSAVVDQFIAECQAAESEEEPPEDEEGGGGGGAPGAPLPRVDSQAATHGQADGGSGGSEPEEFDEFNSTGPGGTHENVDYEPQPGAPLSSCGTPFLLADVALAPLTGFGRLEVALGGAFGTTEGTQFEGFDLFGGGFDFTPPGDTAAPVTGSAAPAAVAGTRASRTTLPAPEAPPPSTPAAPVTGGDATIVPPPQPFKLTGSAASAAWAVGLVGLGLATAMAASDFRRLQVRRRTVTPIS